MTCRDLSDEELKERELAVRLERKKLVRQRSSFSGPRPLPEAIDASEDEYSKLSDAIEQLEERHLHYIEEAERRKLHLFPTPPDPRGGQ